MKKVLLALALIIFSSPAYSADSKGISTTAVMKCSKVIEAHAGYTDKGSSWTGTYETWQVRGYIEGYISAKNKWKCCKSNWFKRLDQEKEHKTGYILNWSASYCRSNPSHDLADALESFSK